MDTDLDSPHPSSTYDVLLPEEYSEQCQKLTLPLHADDLIQFCLSLWCSWVNPHLRVCSFQSWGCSENMAAFHERNVYLLAVFMACKITYLDAFKNKRFILLSARSNRECWAHTPIDQPGWHSLALWTHSWTWKLRGSGSSTERGFQFLVRKIWLDRTLALKLMFIRSWNFFLNF